MNALIRFYREEEGVTAIEYGLIAALIAVVMHCRCHRCWAPTSATLFDDIAAKLDPLTVAERPTRNPAGPRMI